MMLDTKRTFDELVTRYASSPERAKRILDNKLYQYVSTSLAGTQEYMAMEKLHAVRQRSEYDLIVLDTPPTTNALDFLDAPERLIDAIDSPAMRWFIQAFSGAGKLGFNLLGAARRWCSRAWPRSRAASSSRRWRSSSARSTISSAASPSAPRPCPRPCAAPRSRSCS